MLQDYVRTGTYCAAILDNKADFANKAVCDVGAGSGILSLFAAQAGARVVYAVEASNMAQYAAQLAAANQRMGGEAVCNGRVYVGAYIGVYIVVYIGVYIGVFIGVYSGVYI